MTTGTRIIAVSNQKGGVGKSVTTYNLARAAKLRGLKVLAVDADSQGSLTQGLGRDDMDPDHPLLADVLSSHRIPLLSAVTPSVWDGVDLVASKGEGLTEVGAELMAASTGREHRLRKALSDALQEMGEDAYDLILIDCPPALDQLTINALAAADGVLIVTHAGLWSMNGLTRLLSNIADVQEFVNPHLDVAGIVINQFEKNTRNAFSRKLQLENAAEQLGLYVFQPAVPKRITINEASEAGAGLDEYGAKTRDLVDIYDRFLTRLMTKEK